MPVRFIAYTFVLALLALTIQSDARGHGRPAQASMSGSPEVLNQSDLRDERAYSLLFRLLATMPEGATGSRARSYIRLMGLGEGCVTCPRTASSGPAEIAEPDLDAFIRFVEEFKREVGVLDTRAQTIQTASGLSAEERLQQLTALRKRKDTLVQRYVTMLPERLGSDTAARIDQFVQLRFKPRIKQYRISR